MANLLTITKETLGYFSFILNGDPLTEIKNTRNDLLTIGDITHWKTANGANLIKEQDVIYYNVTIIDGATTLTPSSVDDLFIKLDSVEFFDWINGSGGGGVNRFDELIDTFDYFGNDGKIPIVDEAQLKLIPVDFPDVSKLNQFPSHLQPNKMLIVNPTGTAYIFTEAINSPIQVYTFDRLDSPQQDFTIPIGKTAKWAEVNGTTYNLEDTTNATEFNTYTQIDNIVKFKTALEVGEYPVIYLQ